MVSDKYEAASDSRRAGERWCLRIMAIPLKPGPGASLSGIKTFVSSACIHRSDPGAVCREPIRDDPGQSIGGTRVDDSRFDTWTRRKFGLAAGGAAAGGLLALAGLDDADARRRGRRRRRRPQCRRLGQTCNDEIKEQKCCRASQLCAQVTGRGSGNFCCQQIGSSCETSTDCCGNNACDVNFQCVLAR